MKAIVWKAEYITVQYDRDGHFVNTNATIIRKNFVSAIYDVGEIAWDNWEANIEGYILLQNKDTVTRERDSALAIFRFISEHARKTAIPYYHYLTELFPEWKDSLNKAIQALNGCASYGGYLWKRGCSLDEAGIERFRLPQARKDLADAGCRARDQDMLAVEQFEKILSGYSYSACEEGIK